VLIGAALLMIHMHAVFMQYMTLSAAEIQAVVLDLQPRLQGGRIERIDQPDRHRLVLSIRNGPCRYWLLICAHPRFSRLHLLTNRPERCKPAAGFCNVVRQHLTGATIRTVRRSTGDRVVFIECEQRDRMLRTHAVGLVAELVGVDSNLLLLDESGRILASLFRHESQRRSIAVGQPYEPLEAPDSIPAKAHTNRFAGMESAEDALALSRAIQAHYTRAEAADAVETERNALLKAMRRAFKRSRSRQRKLTGELERAENAESVRRKGELLKIALPTMRKGQSAVEVEDLFDPQRPMVTIEVDPLLSPEANLSRLFKDYKKAKSGREKLVGRLASTREEVELLDRLVTEASEAKSLDLLADIRARAEAAGVRLGGQVRRRVPVDTPRGPRSFRSRDGFEILVARSSKENDRLTFSIARGNDHWLHVRGWPGPHVVVRKPRDRDVSHEAILDAAHLAIYFSKIRGTDYAEVDRTQCKYIRRMRGAAPGAVSYAQADTLRIRPDPARLERLLKP